MRNSLILVNPAVIPTNDRSIQYGDASFSTMYASSGHISLLPAHIKRLQVACEKLNITFADWPMLQSVLAKLAAAEQRPCVIKIIISRGSGGRGYQPPETQFPRCIISTHAAKAMQDWDDIELLKVSQIKLPIHDALEGVKHNNRIAQVMAKQEVKELACDDVLMCDSKAHVIEASSANVFYRLAGCWYTPPLNNGGVKGVMRDAFIEYLRSKAIFVNYASHHVDQFCGAQHVLLSNAVNGLRQVRSLEYRGSMHFFSSDLSALITPFIQHILNAGPNN